ncbi:MAG: hypothetical protein AAF487_04650 [Bacteroidota bacterium]
MAKLKAATLIESLMALALIAMITGMAFNLHLRLAKAEHGTHYLKGQFLAEKYLDDDFLYSGEVEHDHYRIEKERKDKGAFDEVQVQVKRKDKLIYSLKVYRENNEN